MVIKINQNGEIQFARVSRKFEESFSPSKRAVKPHVIAFKFQPGRSPPPPPPPPQVRMCPYAYVHIPARAEI